MIHKSLGIGYGISGLNWPQMHFGAYVIDSENFKTVVESYFRIRLSLFIYCRVSHAKTFSEMIYLPFIKQFINIYHQLFLQRTSVNV